MGDYKKPPSEEPAITRIPGGEHITANIFSQLTWWWVGKYVHACYKNKSITNDELPLTPKFCHSENLRKRFAGYFFVDGEGGERKMSLFWALVYTFKRDIALTGFLQFGQNASSLAVPFFIEKLLLWFEDSSQTLTDGIITIVFLCLFTFATSGIFFSWNVMVSFRTGMDMRSVCNSQIYRKAMRLSTASRGGLTQGSIMTLMSTDAEKLPLTMITIHNTWATPMIVFLGLYYLYQKIQNAAFVALAILLGAIPLQGRMGYSTWLANRLQMKMTDARNSIVNESLQGIKILKLYAWENFFRDKINKIRRDEMAHCAKFNYISAYQTMMYVAVPLFINIGTFLFHYHTGGDMSPSTIFTSIALLQIIRMPLTMLPMMVIGFIQSGNALGRMSKFFNECERSNFLDPDFTGSVGDLELDGDFEWGDSTATDEKKGVVKTEMTEKTENGTSAEGVELREIHADLVRSFRLSIKSNEFSVKAGELIAVVGEVGSGKTSLISALLGELEPAATSTGRRGLNGSIAYASQAPWIVNETVQNNILMGLDYDEKKFKSTLEICSLNEDLAMLPAGVETEIGEKGINLSGGQKARLGLARAVYRAADINFLDDPLSAVDAHVGKHLFEKCITGIFKGKTVILATNQLQFLPSVDRIVVLKLGKIEEVGSYSDLYAKGGEFKALMDKHNSKEKNEESEKDNGSRGRTRTRTLSGASSADGAEETGGKQSISNDGVSDKGKLVEEEANKVGSVDSSVFHLYFVKATNGGYKIPIMLCILSVFTQLFWNLHEFMVGFWTVASEVEGVNGEVVAVDNNVSSGGNFTYYFTWWAALGGVSVVLAFGRAVGWAWQGLCASEHLHIALTNNVFHYPMRFFDTTPLGRVVNRFSKDMYMVDMELPKNVSSFVVCLGFTLGTLFTICFALPWFTLVLFPVLVTYHYCQARYRPISRDLQRIESASRSPIFAQFSESLNGVASVRAYGYGGQMIDQCDKLIDKGNRAFWLMHSSNRWLQIRLESLSCLCMTFICFFIVYGKYNDINLDAGFGGLIITYIQAVNGILNWTIRMGCEMEARITSVERIFEMASEEKEAAVINESYRPPAEKAWPSDGNIKVDNLSMRYRSNLDLVLNNVSFSIPPRSKVGVAGRTGSGKSSLLVALFRLCEPESGSSITIDGVDCLKLGLGDLRSNLAIIPQDPVMFCGSVRENLDPTNSFEDADLLEAIKFSFLDDVVSSLEDHVNENGDNFSAGQKQLFCMARAILKKPKVLCLDEATANVDLETDQKLQETIRSHFKESTIITIAHRLNTIIDSDLIIVMDEGKVGEMGKPTELSAKKDSLWSKLLKSSEQAKKGQ